MVRSQTPIAYNFHSSLITRLLVFHLQSSERENYFCSHSLVTESCVLMNYRAVCFRDNLSTFSKSQGSYLESAAEENGVNKMRSRVSESLVMG